MPSVDEPLVARATVTSAVVATDNVAVNVIVPAASSSIDEALLDKVTVGADSFSVIEIVICCAPLSVAEPPDTALISKITVSATPPFSYTESSVGLKATAAAVLPAVIVIVERAA